MRSWFWTAFFILVSMAIVPLIDTEVGSIKTDDPGPSTILEFSIEGVNPLDKDGALSFSEPKISFKGDILLGLSNGNTFEEVVDPTPGAPMIPWFATVIETRRDIDGFGISNGISIPFKVPSGLATIPPAVDHWEEEIPYGIWKGETTYPEYPIRLDPIGYRHRNGETFRVYSLWYTPIMLDNNGEGEISIEPSIELSMSDDLAGPSLTRSEGDASLVPGTLSVADNMDIPPEYLIITYRENVDELRVLANWRNRKGLATSVIDIDHILGNYSGSEDPADLLREYIKDVHSIWGRLRYVMLAGDWETVPVKKVFDSDPSEWDDGWIPADSYYQCLDGTWDLNGNGIFGEVGDLEDIIPDIVVSRLAIDEGNIWEKKVDQIIEYEMGEQLGSWVDTAVLIGAHTHSEGDGTQYSNYLWDKYLKDAYEVGTTLYEDEQTLSHDSIDDSLEAGTTFVQFVDHGGPNEWCDNYGAGVVYRSRDARSLSNDARMPFISALACLTTWFDDTSGCPYGNWENCLGESFTENTNGGAIGYVGSSRVSVGIITANRYLPYDNGLIEDIARQIGGQGNYVMGDVHTGGKAHYAEVWGGGFDNPNNPEIGLCWMEFTLLGEPACGLWTGSDGQLISTVEHEDDLDPHITVFITDGSGEPVEGANVSLQNFDRRIFQISTTDVDGKVVFDLVLDWFCDINLTVTKQNMIPYSGFIRISDVIPPLTDIVTIPSEPDGENGWFLNHPRIKLIPNERAKVHYRIDTGPSHSINASMNFTLPALPEGEHDIHFFAEDEAGNLEVEQHVTIRSDTLDPLIDLTLNPSEPDGMNGWYTTEPMITLSKDEEDSGSEVRFMCDMDGEVIEYSGPFFVPEGEHLIDIWAMDNSGRSSNITQLDLKVDIRPPRTEIEIYPDEPDGENGWYVTNPEVILTPSEPDCSIEYRISSSPFNDYQGDLILPDGRFDLEYRSVDPSGNIERTRSLFFKIDTSPPTTDYRIYPPFPDGKDGFYITTPSLMFQWKDDHDATLFVSMDGSSWIDWKGSEDIPDGIHQIEAFSEDDAGHRSSVISLELKVDTEYPETEVQLTGARHEEWFTSKPTVSFRTSEDSITFYRIDTFDEFSRYDSPFILNIAEGRTRLYYFSEDRGGNTADEEVLMIKVDIEKPRLSLEYSVSDAGVLELSAEGSRDGTQLEYLVSIDGKVTRDWSTDPVHSIELSPGSYLVKMDVRDEAGNTASRTVLIEVEGPNFILIAAIVIGVIMIIGLVLFLAFRRRHSGYEGYMQLPDHHGYDDG